MRHPHHHSRLRKALSRTLEHASYATRTRIATGQRVAILTPNKPYRPDLVVFCKGKVIQVKRAAKKRP